LSNDNVNYYPSCDNTQLTISQSIYDRCVCNNNKLLNVGKGCYKDLFIDLCKNGQINGLCICNNGEFRLQHSG